MITQQIEILINKILSAVLADDVSDSKMEKVEKMFRDASVLIANTRFKMRRVNFQALKGDSHVSIGL